MALCDARPAHAASSILDDLKIAACSLAGRKGRSVRTSSVHNTKVRPRRYQGHKPDSRDHWRCPKLRHDGAVGETAVACGIGGSRKHPALWEEAPLAGAAICSYNGWVMSN